jgi:acetyl esterase/lipase/lysophospholipase L1-like esterase
MENHKAEFARVTTLDAAEAAIHDLGNLACLASPTGKPWEGGPQEPILSSLRNTSVRSCHRLRRIATLAFASLAMAWQPSHAQSQTPPPIPPTFADVAYGSHPQQLLDFWQAKSSKPTPVIFQIHGGGWIHGPKEALGRNQGFLRSGISVVHITYRFAPANPLPGPVMDAARALQFVRSKAAEWNLDPNRVIVSGFSAGGCSALWLATHEDLANPNSSDPVERESTRVSGAMVAAAQTTIEPDLVRDWIGEEAFKHAMIRSAGGFKTNDDLLKAFAGNADTARLYRKFSPINHLTADDPPILLEYGQLSPEKHGGIHGAEFGVEFKKQADAVGVAQCWLRVDKDEKFTGYPGGAAKFVQTIFNSTGATPTGSSAATPAGAKPRAATPVPKTENQNWMPQHDANVALARKGGIDVLFIGDSITKCWSREGRDVWAARFAALHAENFGISGDCTQHVLWRLQNGELENMHPKVVVVLIGTNNISARDSPADIAQAVGAIVGEIRHHAPASRILLLGILPNQEFANHPNREKIRATNHLISQLQDGDRITYLDFGNRLLQPDGTLTVEIAKDFCHLTPKGYEIFADAIQPTVESLLPKP